jgi:hypothetical protein
VFAAFALALVACTATESPTPAPSPTPDAMTEPAPSGVTVAVVLPAPDDPRSAAFLDADGQLDALVEERVGDVAAARTVVPDDADFVLDVAALLADGGTDLVCVLGGDGVRVALALADRFPATRFCALGPPREGQPPNVDLFDVAHEELGHVLGVAVRGAAGTGQAGLVLGDDGDDAVRRRAGARAALAGTPVGVDAVVRDATEVTELIDALDDVDLAALLVDHADPVLATALAALAPLWVGPRGVPIDSSAGSPVVRWSLRADVVVGASLDRLVGAEEDEVLTTLGSAHDLFVLTFADGVAEGVRTATEAAAEELAAGTRDPLAPPEGTAS